MNKEPKNQKQNTIRIPSSSLLIPPAGMTRGSQLSVTGSLDSSSVNGRRSHSSTGHAFSSELRGQTPSSFNEEEEEEEDDDDDEPSSPE